MLTASKVLESIASLFKVLCCKGVGGELTSRMHPCVTTITAHTHVYELPVKAGYKVPKCTVICS